jgi:hypothetical protein
MRGVYFLLGILLFSGCVPEPEFPELTTPVNTSETILFVLNEGIWTYNNATVDAIYPELNCKRSPDIYSYVNQEPLGDVANSALVIKDTAWIVMNGSKLIYKILLPEFRKIGTLALPADANPREIISISASKACIVSLTNQTLYAFNPATMKLLFESGTAENYMESGCLVGEEIWVSCGNYAGNNKNNKLAVFDAATLSLKQYILLPVENPGKMRYYKDKIYILCRGNYSDIPSALAVVNPDNHTLDTMIALNSSAYDFDQKKDSLFILSDKKIFKYTINSKELDFNYMDFSSNTEILYSMLVDSGSNRFFISGYNPSTLDGKLWCYSDHILSCISETGLFPGTLFLYKK